MVASGGVLPQGYGHGGPGVCLGDGQTEAYLKDTGMTGLASVWAMARGRTKEYRRKVDAATAYVPIPDLPARPFSLRFSERHQPIRADVIAARRGRDTSLDKSSTYIFGAAEFMAESSAHTIVFQRMRPLNTSR